MQVQKEELRLQILEAAKQEFLAKGYENSSMRTIAKKANTTLGNIYHYFQNKEDLLNTLLTPAVQNLEIFAKEHLDQKEEYHSFEEIELAFHEIDDNIDQTIFQYLMDERLLILFDLKTTRFVDVREDFIARCKKHMQFHLKLNDDSKYLEIITEMFIHCIRHILLEQKNPKDAKKEFMKVFRMLCTGITSIEE
ncbi:TetR/AcrR family transcriptional regulator [[Eubacterium] hominis]|uniref:TetR/AcrR family transcriptional regulator n=1 Tax=[Eubacterium] hominis TaxID=2764325 RepID=UPI003A4D47C7